jgi:dATP pyrophosphohydrolase
LACFRRPESILVIVYTNQADVLLLKRMQPFSFWQSVTGTLETSEDHAHAARRELREETGLTSEGELTTTGRYRKFEIDPRWRDRYAPGVSINKEHEYRYQLNSRADIHLDPLEHSAYKWVSIDAVIDKVWSWTNKVALQSLREDL